MLLRKSRRNGTEEFYLNMYKTELWNLDILGKGSNVGSNPSKGIMNDLVYILRNIQNGFC